jgi:hypothetical protein
MILIVISNKFELVLFSIRTPQPSLIHHLISPFSFALLLQHSCLLLDSNGWTNEIIACRGVREADKPHMNSQKRNADIAVSRCRGIESIAKKKRRAKNIGNQSSCAANPMYK